MMEASIHPYDLDLPDLLNYIERLGKPHNQAKLINKPKQSSNICDGRNAVDDGCSTRCWWSINQ
jgi:hypothetical protein